MAFPIPSHLPRRAAPEDVTTKILSRMDEATSKSLTASLAQSWLEELDATIQSTKEKIHDRIHADLPEFERQWQTSISVQTRLRTLTTEVDSLNHALHDSESGLIPSLVKTLTAHSTLAQKATNARIKREALAHLQQCKETLSTLEDLEGNGDLPDAVNCCTRMEELLRDAPAALAQSDVYMGLKRKCNAAKARIEEQLSDAYSRCVSVIPHELTIAQSVQVRQSERTLSLAEILTSSSSTSLDNHLNTLRRDITIHYIDILLTQPMSVVEQDIKITCFPSPPNEEVIESRIDNLSRTLRFLYTHLFIHLPVQKRTSFLQSLCKPVTSSLLNNLLISNLPSTFSRLSSFLKLAKSAVAFEQDCIIGLLGNDASDCTIKTWVDGLGGHYERQRRVHILENARNSIIKIDDFSNSFQVEVEIEQAAPEPEVVPVQEEVGEDAWGLDEGDSSTSAKVEDDGWGFDKDEVSAEENEDGWGFDEEAKTGDSETVDDGWGFDDTAEESTGTTVHDSSSEPKLEANGIGPEPEPEPDDAWGLDDEVPADEASLADETNWDDPWGESTSAPPSASVSLSSVKSPPKVATRLEKLANKGKKGINGNSPMNSPSIPMPSTPNVPSSPAIPSTSSKTKGSPSPSSLPHASNATKVPDKRPPDLSFSPPKELYLVSSRMKDIVALVRETLKEGHDFCESRLLSAPESSSPSGTILFQTAASILDLYRALYPVVFSGILRSIEGPVRFSNNCLYLSTQVEAIGKELHGSNTQSVKGRLDECGQAFKLLSESWYGDAIEKQRQIIDNILTTGTQGLDSTGDQERYDDCENTMNQVLQEIRRISQKWKTLLTKSKYYTALGSVVDAALCRVLQDVLALGDIPEVESHRLSELCRILLALEGLFSEDPEKPSFVVAYVPSWLKFSYLSELLEASLADITYLFEEGALVDFEVEELVRLVRALFADTVLRTNTVNKILSGHPSPK